MQSIAELLNKLEADPWRLQNPFSQDLSQCQAELLQATTDARRAEALSAWLVKYQPCLFGRIAAQLGLISYCFLTDQDLSQEDEHVRDKIQAARTSWTRDGFKGSKSALIILAVSEKIATAVPSLAVEALAKRLCSLYLLDDCECDQIYMDDIFLEKPGVANVTWKWKTGVNYFCAQGDGRWWLDHRIPGGMAYSVNSVGHMVKSGRLVRLMKELDKELDVTDEEWDASHLDSLPQALLFAMKTIANAATAPSGKATELLPKESIDSEIKCPIELPPKLREKSHCVYRGHYHTDFTIPTEYFLPDMNRPAQVSDHRLDFTYLFDGSVSNPANITMGKGQRTRDFDFEPFVDHEAVRAENRTEKLSRTREEEVAMTNEPRLVHALAI